MNIQNYYKSSPSIQAYSITMALGAISIFTFAPVFFWPLAFVIFPCLLFFIEKFKTPKCRFLLGFSFVLGVSLTHFYWGKLMVADYFTFLFPDQNIALDLVSWGIVMLFLLPGFFIFGGVFIVMGWGIDKMSYQKYLWPWILAGGISLATCFMGVPYQNKFPWMSFGYMTAENLYLAQLATLIGVGGLGFLAIGLSGSLFLIQSKKHAGILFFIMITWVAFGVWRVEFSTPLKKEETTEIKIRLIQANLDKDHYLSERGKKDGFLKYTQISKDPKTGVKASSLGWDSTLLIWPETAAPYFINENEAILSKVKDLGFNEVLTGALYRGFDPINQKDVLYNIAGLITEQKGLEQFTAKQVLVPFGEYRPLENQFSGLYQKFLKNRPAFATGTTSPIINSQTAGDILVLNCYEILFPDRVKTFADQSNFILHISNDVWFQNSYAMEYIFYVARLRAIEAQKPLIRSTNFGINAMFDAYGRILFKRQSEFPEAQDITLTIKKSQ